MNFKSLVHAARLRTLPLSVSCVITGSAMAYYLGAFGGLIFFYALLTTVLLQILSNFANDLGDYEKGTDNHERIGPARALQSGMLTAENMKKIVQATIALTIISGIVLLLVAHLSWLNRGILFVLGLASIAAAMHYTSGKSYGYKGYGDLFVFLFFGIVGVCGTLFLYINTLNNASLLPASGLGLLTVLVLHLNNMRDRENDQKNGKITLAVRLGIENSKLYFLFLVLGGILLWGSYVFTQTITNAYSYLYWFGFLPFVWILIRFFRVKNPSDYDTLLKPTALSVFLVSVLFFLSQFL